MQLGLSLGPSLAAVSCWLGLDSDNGIQNWLEGGKNPAGLLAVVAPSSLSSGQCQMITLFPRCLAASKASVLEMAWEAFEDLGLAVCLSPLLKPQSLISFKEMGTDRSPTQVEMKEFAELLEENSTDDQIAYGHTIKISCHS